MSAAAANVTFSALRSDHRSEIASLDAIRASDDISPSTQPRFSWKVWICHGRPLDWFHLARQRGTPRSLPSVAECYAWSRGASARWVLYICAFRYIQAPGMGV